MALTANIEDVMILGMDDMTRYGFEHNLNKGNLEINGEEIIMHKGDTDAVLLIVAEDVSLPEISEVIVESQLAEDKVIDGILLLEPKHHDLEDGK